MKKDLNTKFKEAIYLNNSRIYYLDFKIRAEKIFLKHMGEAKRRAQLGISPRKKISNFEKSDRYVSWIPITKTRIKKYPYMGVATMALGAIIFLVSGGFNTIS